MLVFLSARSVRSKWVAEEIRLASQEFGKPFRGGDSSSSASDLITDFVHGDILRQVLTDLGKKLTRTEGLGYKVIAACHARFLLISAQGIGTDRDDRDRL